jgi:hypothetical protein
MSEGTSNETADRGILVWVTMTVGAVLFLYLFSFAVLVLFPPAAKASGLSSDTLEKIYYPILRFLR